MAPAKIIGHWVDYIASPVVSIREQDALRNIARAKIKGWTCDGGMVVRREMATAIDRYKARSRPETMCALHIFEILERCN